MRENRIKVEATDPIAEEGHENFLLREKITSYLKQRGLVTETPDGDVWNLHMIREMFNDVPTIAKFRNLDGSWVKLNKITFFNTFKYETVRTRPFVEGEVQSERIFFCPKSKNELNDVSALADAYRASSCGPWDLGKIQAWGATVTLADGAEITYEELYDAYRRGYEKADPDMAKKEMQFSAEVHLKDNGVIKLHKEDNEVVVTWDVRRLAQIADTDFFDRLYVGNPNGPWRRRRASCSNKTDFIRLFSDKKVLSEEDFAEGKRKPKQLFFIPESKEEVFPKNEGETSKKLSISSASERAYLMPWELGKIVSEWDAPITCRNGDAVPLDELYLAQKIYGDFQGRRDPKTAVLTVWDEEKKKRVEFSGEWLKMKIKSKFTNSKAKYSFHRQAEFLLNRGKDLLASGLLRLEDFGATTQSGAEFVQNIYRFGRRGVVYIGGSTGSASYNLGTDYSPERHPEYAGVIEMELGRAGILKTMPDGTQRIVATFPLKSRDEISVRRDAVRERLLKEKESVAESRITMGVRFKKKEVTVTPYDITAQTKPFAGEDVRAYGQRITTIPQPQFIRKSMQEFSQEIGIGLHRRLSFREQQWLATYINERPQDRDVIARYAKEFGEDFLSLFSFGELGIEHSEQLIRFVEAIPAEQAKDVFCELRAISEAAVDSARLVASWVADKTDIESTAENIRLNLLRRGAKLFDLTEGRIVQKALDRARADIVIFTEAFKAVRDEISISDVKDATLVSCYGSELSTDDIDTMRNLYESNYRENAVPYKEEFIQELLSGFDWAIKSNSTVWHIFRHNGEIVAFRRFDKIKDNEYYTGSLNLDPAYAEHGIASAFMEKTQQSYVESGATLTCYFDIRQKLWMRRIADGYVGVAYEPSHNGVPAILARFSASENDAYASKNQSDEDLIRTALKGEKSGSPLVIADTSSLESLHLLNEGYVLTRVIPGSNNEVFMAYEIATKQSHSQLLGKGEPLAA